MWMAGFFDGEGCVTIQRQCRQKVIFKSKLIYDAKTHNLELVEVLVRIYSSRIVVVSMSRPAIELFQNKFGGNIEDTLTPIGKPFHRWYLDKRDRVKDFVEEISPYCIVKQPQFSVIKLFLDLPVFPRSKTISEEEHQVLTKKEELYQLIRDLNGRRHSPSGRPRKNEKILRK